MNLAEFFEVDVTTIDKWIAEIPEFSRSVKEAKAELDNTVERRLFERATGYSHPDDHITTCGGEIVVTPTTKHYAPDTAACIFWLKNRRREHWRDRQDLEHTGKDGGAIETKDISELDLARSVAFILNSGLQKGAKADG